MDDYVYYWKKLDIYCYKSELNKFVQEHGRDYTFYLSGEFFSKIWGK